MRCSVCSSRLMASSLFAFLFVAVAGWSLSGCVSPGQAVQRGLNSASEAAGEQVGKAIGSQLAAAANLPPAGTARWNQFMVGQAQVLFTYAFSAGGFWPSQATYEPGEWTMYRLAASDDNTAALDTLERAFLTRTEDGNEWWRVRGFQDDNVWFYEALIDPERGRVVRMRAKDPEGTVSEVPVTEGTVYQPPQRLTAESIEGATEGTESVTTPAGTFTARRVVYSGATAGGTVTWFLSDEVPGHVVTYKVESDDSSWTSTLTDHGTDATTQLDSY